MLTTNVLCLKKRKKRRYCVSDVSDYGQRPAIDKRSPGSVVSMMHITEDTPPDMLAGAMDLTVHLPSGRAVKMSVERSTPMMDLLVQIVTAHQLQLSGHIIQALEMAPSAGLGDRILPYKPNTPIGALDTQHIKVLPKNRNLPATKNLAPGHQPFESTFRLKVHLPRNQLYVTRVSQHVYLEDIMSKVCKEKDLDPVKYEFRHPGNLDEVLDPKLTLSDYQITEIYVVSKGTGRLTQAFSSSDIMALRKEEERKQFQAKTGGGVFNLIFKRGKPTGGTGSVSSDNRSISPIHSDDSRSVTPPTVQPQILKELPPEKPKPPQRKRRQAPKPPQIAEERKASVEKPASQISNNSDNSTTSKKGENGLLISHSRNSSDSSGYHEASILSDHCNTSLPRRPRTMVVNEDVNDGKLSGEHSKSTGNLTKMSLQSKSTSSLAFAGRKKKAAPPPPPVLKRETSVTKAENASPVVVASQPVETQKESVSTVPINQTPPESLSSTRGQSINASASTSARTSISNLQIPKPETEAESITPENVVVEKPREIITAIAKEAEKEQINTSASSSDSKTEADSGICENMFSDSVAKDDMELETEWQYQLPSPPKGFRDASPSALMHLSNGDTESVGDHKADSVVSNPELFEKLKRVRKAQRDSQSDITSVTSEDAKDDEICNKLSLENLEKRKSLVYNRELATSLKYAQEEPSSFSEAKITKSNVLNELEDAIVAQKSSTLLRTNKPQENFKTSAYDKNLPNFKISTYDPKKEKINIFEDDTVRSSSEIKQNPSSANTPNSDVVSRRVESPTEKPAKRNSMEIRKEDDVFKKPEEINKYRLKSNFYEKNKVDVGRSESFSGSWAPFNPVKRSKSQVALNKYKEEHNHKTGSNDNLSKSNSLFDVSGLQSLEVIRMIQTKLSNSTEQLDPPQEQKPVSVPVKEDPPVQKPSPSFENTTQVPPAKVFYRGPPSINLGTWSQRPKTQVQLKEDTDYKFSTINSRNVPGNNNTSTNFNEDGHKSLNVKVNGSDLKQQQNSSSNGVSIKINGSEPIVAQKSGNVVIKIGGTEQPVSSRFVSHTTADIYKKPLGNVTRTRPHSIALDSQFDISHVPIVRSVELKKPFKDLQTTNTSITQIYQDNNTNFKLSNNEPKSLSYLEPNAKNESKNSVTYFSNESTNKTNFRNNNFAPVVKGFRTDSNANRKTWNAYGTLPSKPTALSQNDSLNTNQNVPFSQSNLRRTESNKIIGGNVNNNNIFGNVVLRNAPISNSNSFRNSYGDNVYSNSNKVESRTVSQVKSTPHSPPPPPPQMPKISTKPIKTIESEVDHRDQLLSAIRNFGGKKGLRTTKS